MSYQELPCTFACAGERLVGILALPAPSVRPNDSGVVIVVGGPQYRAGSHRQFTLLARHLAACGFPVLRFDTRGMGDSSGELRDFESLSDDVAAAVDALTAHCPQVRQVALWGLCDGASAALLYVAERADPRVRGLCLLNPWVRSPAGLARAHVKHYYAQRLFERAFWRKLFTGQVGFGALRGLVSALRAATAKTRVSTSVAALPFQQRMALAWRGFSGKVLLILSGNDLVAREFIDHAEKDHQWRPCLAAAGVQRLDLATANHTFSEEGHASEVAHATARWLTGLAAPVGPAGSRRPE